MSNPFLLCFNGADRRRAGNRPFLDQLRQQDVEEPTFFTGNEDFGGNADVPFGFRYSLFHFKASDFCFSSFKSATR
jgi:hypothetical protein